MGLPVRFDCGQSSVKDMPAVNESLCVRHRRQYCGRCNQLMFEYYASPDGHFGLANFVEGAHGEESPGGREVRCGKCGARYRLLDRLNGMAEPVVRI